MNGTYTGVVDRIVDDTTAVVLLEDDGDTVEQLDLAVERLPADGRHEGALFEVTMDEGTPVDFAYQPNRESNRRERLQSKFDRLSRRLDEDSRRLDEDNS